MTDYSPETDKTARVTPRQKRAAMSAPERVRAVDELVDLGFSGVDAARVVYNTDTPQVSETGKK